MSAVASPSNRPQAISGVSASAEAEIMTAYPSIAAYGLGRRIGAICESVPLKTTGLSWPRLFVAVLLWPIVVPIAIPLSLGLYALQKLTGTRYVLTNRSLTIRSMLGIRSMGSVALSDIKQLLIEELPGQAFYKAADLEVRAADGKTLLRLPGVQRASVFRQTILEARDARQQVEASLNTIRTRKV